MTKREIKKAENHEIITDLVKTYSLLIRNINLGGGIESYSIHCNDLMTELLNRGLLTQEEINYLNT